MGSRGYELRGEDRGQEPPAQQPDQELLEQAQRGDERALTQLLEAHTPAICQQLAGRIPARWQAVLSVEDILQQTYTDVFLRIQTFSARSGGSFRAWLRTIANHNLLSALEILGAQKRGGKRGRIAWTAPDDSYVALYDALSGSRTSPSQCLARKEARSALQQAIDTLPDAYRRVVQMYDLEGQPVEQVAQALRRSPGAVYMVRARAHERLQVLLDSSADCTEPHRT